MKITYAELEAFYGDVSGLASDLENERTVLDEAAEAVGTPFGESDLKSALELFHEDWNTAQEELITSLEDAKEHAYGVAEGWRNIDATDLAELKMPVCSPIED